MPETEEHIYSSTVATFLASTNFTPWRDDPSDGSACRADHHYDQRGVILWKQLCLMGFMQYSALHFEYATQDKSHSQ